MKTILEYLYNRKGAIKSSNKFNITKKDLIGGLKGFPIGVVIRMLEEQELQGNKPNVKVFQKDKYMVLKNGGFDWDSTKEGRDFWVDVITFNDFDKFYKKYPEYKKYDS